MAYTPTSALVFGPGGYTPTGALVFGAEQGGGPAPSYTLTLAATLPRPAPSAALHLVATAPLSLAATLPSPALSAALALEYDPQVWRGPGASAAPTWVAGRPAPLTRAPAWRPSPPRHTHPAAAWAEGQPAPYAPGLHHQALPRRPAVAAPGWSEGLSAPRALATPWLLLSRRPLAADAPWRPGRPVPLARVLAYLHLARAHQVATAPWAPPAAAGAAWVAPVRPPVRRVLVRGLPWAEGRLRPGRYPWPGPPGPAPAPPYTPTAALVFRCPWTGTAALVFREPACAPGPLVIPVRRVYRVRNTFDLQRVADGLAVDALAFSCQIDADSWTWTWSATVPGTQLDRVLSTVLEEPVELLATLNGTPLRLVAEGLTRERRFGYQTLRLSGRGRGAWLAAPYSPVLTTSSAAALTAAQAAALALQENGAGIGWTVDWALEDWLIAAGAWSHTGTHLEAVARLAEAGGGYVQPHDTAEVLRLLPYYPLAPWEWSGATPDLTLPEDVVTLEGIEWLSRPAYEAVYVVGGAAGGRQDRIRRAGTAGAVMAPTVTDPLATDPIMTRARGLRVLADTGRQAHLSLRLPVLPETGIIRPGTLVAYTAGGVERRGLCRGVSVTHELSAAWQTIRIETHESV